MLYSYATKDTWLKKDWTKDMIDAEYTEIKVCPCFIGTPCRSYTEWMYCGKNKRASSACVSKRRALV